MWGPLNVRILSATRTAKCDIWKTCEVHTLFLFHVIALCDTQKCVNTSLLILRHSCRCHCHRYFSPHRVIFNQLLQNFACALRISLVACMRFRCHSVTTCGEWLSDTKLLRYPLYSTIFQDFVNISPKWFELIFFLRWKFFNFLNLSS